MGMSMCSGNYEHELAPWHVPEHRHGSDIMAVSIIATASSATTFKVQLRWADMIIGMSTALDNGNLVGDSVRLNSCMGIELFMCTCSSIGPGTEVDVRTGGRVDRMDMGRRGARARGMCITNASATNATPASPAAATCGPRVWTEFLALMYLFLLEFVGMGMCMC